MLRYGSVCSGIEAATVAWHPLGWQPVFFAEIEAFPSAVLARHYGSNMPGQPLARNGVPNHGDFTTIGPAAGPIDLLVGGTPCQSFSIAGLRGGLGDDRGNLALEYLRLAQRLRPRWLVWENVPGVLSSAGGRDFGAILGGMVELGYGFAYRVLDAQFIRVDGYPRAVPQRRRRVFVVGYLGDWRRAAAVLFERESLSGHPAPRREAGKGAAAPIAAGSHSSSGYRNDADTSENLIAFGGGNTSAELDVSTALTAHGRRQDFEVETFLVAPPIAKTLTRGAESAGKGGDAGRRQEDDGNLVAHTLLAKSNDSHAADLDTYVAHTLRAEGFDASEDGTGRGPPIVPVAPTLRAGGNQTGGDRPYGTDVDTCDSLIPIAFDTTQITSKANRSAPQPGDPCHPLTAGAHPPAVAFDARQSDVLVYGDKTGPLDTDASSIGIQSGWAVRRLTPRECERLQGFPDDYTLIPHRKGMAADGPRYKALGNSMAVNVMRWIGQRIAMVEELG